MSSPLKTAAEGYIASQLCLPIKPELFTYVVICQRIDNEQFKPGKNDTVRR